MGKRGARLTSADKTFHDEIMDRLQPLGDLGSRSMFGGYGLFEKGVMFALISAARLYLKADESSRADFEEAGSERHLSMPYYEVPLGVMEDSATLHKWARRAITIAHVTTKKKGKQRKGGS